MEMVVNRHSVSQYSRNRWGEAWTTVMAAVPVVPLLCRTGAAGVEDAPREPAPASKGSAAAEATQTVVTVHLSWF
ncbi:hypothetical protein AV530_019178 [Patagioenas fasciata monilis]|uniref:Uncharacterized protein n=1 Tax=Patagioenas fasciata monilis TaxID=372326 RepID=A0A1V4KXQ6_PATFA|nr:hypothetical protein AV530_019178 [Patagioenas fasciata monilis]